MCQSPGQTGGDCLGPTFIETTGMTTPSAAADRPRFVTVLVRVLAVQLGAGLLLWLLQTRYTR